MDDTPVSVDNPLSKAANQVGSPQRGPDLMEECLLGCFRCLQAMNFAPSSSAPVAKFPRYRRQGYELHGTPKITYSPKVKEDKEDTAWTPKHHVMEPKDSKTNRFEKVSQHLRDFMSRTKLLPADLTFDKTYKILSQLEVVADMAKMATMATDRRVAESATDSTADEEASEAGNFSISSAETPPAASPAQAVSSEDDCDKVLAVHRFMLKEVRKFVEEFKSAPGVFYDFDTARLCTGVATLVKLEDEFHLTKADLDALMALHQEKLKKTSDFRHVTDEINELLSEFDEP
eukprot:s922_g7.t1